MSGWNDQGFPGNISPSRVRRSAKLACPLIGLTTRFVGAFQPCNMKSISFGGVGASCDAFDFDFDFGLVFSLVFGFLADVFNLSFPMAGSVSAPLWRGQEI